MAFMDKLKDVAGKAAEKANSVKEQTLVEIDKAKEANEIRKAEKEAYIASMQAETELWCENMVGLIVQAYDSNKPKLFSELEESTLEKFSKEYYEMLVLPGSRPNISCLTMNPYIDEKAVKKISKKFTIYDATEKPLIYLKEANGQELIMTRSELYFRLKHNDSKEFFRESKISLDKINTFEIIIEQTGAKIMINGIQFSEFKITGSYRQDFMSLNYYFDCIKKNDLDIKKEEIDLQIKEKIGNKIYQQVAKYFADEEEKLLFYAGGLDSLTAVDYIACTDTQMIIVNREAFGATSNVKQFYYEDITAMASIQNSQADGLVASIIDTAITAALKICNLQVSVAGSKETISNIFLLEANRIISIYHQLRKESKKAKSEGTQTIINQAAGPDALEQLEKLSKLKDSGIITEEEFQNKKAALLERL